MRVSPSRDTSPHVHITLRQNCWTYQSCSHQTPVCTTNDRERSVRQTRLVLFEGIPGSGKSTTGQFLARQIADQGFTVRTNSIALPNDLTHYVGTYRSQNNGDEEEICEVRLENGSLYLLGVPHLWPRTRLLPKTLDTFDVESYPFTATFSADATQTDMTLTITGPATGFQPVAWVSHMVSDQITDNPATR